ncbi:MAG: CdaR family protein [Thermodesulfobacteriota bacterium]
MEKLVKQILENLFGSWTWPRNWVLKLVSLFVATFLWYFVAGENKVDMNVKVPVEIINLPSSLVISNDYKTELEVTVTGPLSLIRNLERSHTSRTVDLSKAEPGPVVVTNSPDSIPLPWGVELNRVNPAEFIVQLDRLIEKNIPIQPITSGKISSGYKLISVMLEPSDIKVTAPKAVIDELQTINTKPLPIDDLTSSTMAHTSLDLTDKVAEIIGDPVVTASIIIEERQEHRSISNVPLSISDQRAGMAIAPETVRVMVNMPYSLIKKTEDFKTLVKAQVAGKDLKPGLHKVEVTVIPTAGVKVLEIAPATVEISVPRPGKKRAPIIKSPKKRDTSSPSP